MPRLAPLPKDFDSPEVDAVFAAIRARGEQPSPLYRTLAHSPRMLAAWASLAWPLRHETSIAGRLRELIVLRIAQLTQTPYQWAYHVHPGLSSGLSREQLKRLADWRRTDLFDDEERAVLAYAERVADLTVDDATYEDVARLFSAEQVVELTMTAAFYSNVSRVLQALQIELDPPFAAEPELVM
ncbi:MAG: carboxymuconolactone decarboxylase family protein [Candidatus Dormibacteria bacterium]